MAEKLVLVMYPRYGTMRHGVDGKWPPNQVTPNGGGWTMRAKHTWCGLPTEHEYTWIKPIDEVDCRECVVEYVATKLGDDHG